MNDKQAIVDLYYKYAHEAHRLTDESMEIIHRLNDEIEKFTDKLTPEQKMNFEEIMERENELGGITEKNIFIFDFSLATKIWNQSNMDMNKNSEDI